MRQRGRSRSRSAAAASRRRRGSSARDALRGHIPAYSRRAGPTICTYEQFQAFPPNTDHAIQMNVKK